MRPPPRRGSSRNARSPRPRSGRSAVVGPVRPGLGPVRPGLGSARIRLGPARLFSAPPTRDSAPLGPAHPGLGPARPGSAPPAGRPLGGGGGGARGPPFRPRRLPARLGRRPSRRRRRRRGLETHTRPPPQPQPSGAAGGTGLRGPATGTPHGAIRASPRTPASVQRDPGARSTGAAARRGSLHLRVATPRAATRETPCATCPGPPHAGAAQPHPTRGGWRLPRPLAPLTPVPAPSPCGHPPPVSPAPRAGLRAGGGGGPASRRCPVHAGQVTARAKPGVLGPASVTHHPQPPRPAGEPLIRLQVSQGEATLSILPRPGCVWRGGDKAECGRGRGQAEAGRAAPLRRRHPAEAPRVGTGNQRDSYGCAQLEGRTTIQLSWAVAPFPPQDKRTRAGLSLGGLVGAARGTGQGQRATPTAAWWPSVCRLLLLPPQWRLERAPNQYFWGQHLPQGADPASLQPSVTPEARTGVQTGG